MSSNSGLSFHAGLYAGHHLNNRDEVQLREKLQAAESRHEAATEALREIERVLGEHGKSRFAQMAIEQIKPFVDATTDW